eukprot:CAMPEP_0170169146 /NCGR_PEP_ID=MMETSP0040_2-20121228/2088_1 /TAXON_ID=641309 /ORGANISM="Lotharella oceanica, Strain CCMP622" /LENGTH=84 /DNA_ID=CAMNT_0010407739 /DNA_START=173 /DNA_END=427 /DNA_ORIENTATION=-
MDGASLPIPLTLAASCAISGAMASPLLNACSVLSRSSSSMWAHLISSTSLPLPVQPENPKSRQRVGLCSYTLQRPFQSCTGSGL